MALAAKLQLRQSQSLVMTPQLMQSIRLLQLTHLELERFIDEEIERNPFLERAEPPEDTVGEPEPKEPDGRETPASEDWFETDAPASAETMSERLDTSLENLFPDDPGTAEAPGLAGQRAADSWKSSPGDGSAPPPQGYDMEAMAAAATTLHGHVGEQIALAFHDPALRLIAAELADNLDNAGYLQADMTEIAARLGADPAAMAKALAVCQTFEPTGIFARDLSECLALQLAARNRFDPAMQALVAHLDLLAKRDFQSLKRLCGVDEEDLLDMLAEIRALGPRPGMVFSEGGSEPVIADIEVQAAADGTWTVELNPETLPRVLIDQSYFTHVSATAKQQADRDFLAECLQSANWLVRSLDQRAKTILKVASEIVRRQDAFLVHGVRHLKPLNLKAVADAIGMHESTVSRVTANKYMLTPRGVFELRYFFTAAIASSEGGEAHSSEAVRDRIRQLVDEETAADILSDDAIVDMLKAGGIDIARRTVAKYREAMAIPSSVQRRREKRALAGAGR
ncbi:MAG: RNA polymerase factor sigma-54 [Mesorhizobium sp.]